MLLLILLVSGFGIAPSYSNHDYDFVPDKKSWLWAQRYCRDKNTDLATVEDETQQSILEKTTPTPSNRELAWLGLRLNMSYWWWTVDEKYQPSQYFNWSLNEPQELMNCAIMRPNGLWRSGWCTGTLYSFVCFTQEGDNKTYHLVNGEQTTYDYDEARDHCREHFKDLALIETPGENEAVWKLLKEVNKEGWIGLSRKLLWVWPWPTNFKPFRKWAEGQPLASQTCAAMDLSTKEWRTPKCGLKLPFICNAGPRQTVVRLQIQSEGDLTDPAIHSQLLQQLHMALAKQATGFKLRWIAPPEKKAKKGKDEL